LRAASFLLPGVARVQAQIKPYADAWQASNKRALTDAGPLWVVMGDSMSQGIGATAYDHGWVGQLRDYFAAQGIHYRVVNLSVTGSRVEDVLGRQLPVLQTLPAPALVTVLVGANNMVKTKYQTTLLHDLQQLLVQLPEGTIIGSITGNNAISAAANNLIRQTVATRHFKVADMSKAFRPPVRPKVASDHFHPNDVGYREIAEVFKEAIDQ
jgi:lysophospholipase L1-like esterase